ncbi:MAG: Fur family transcriptional regulator [Chloroflexota bacterium]
MDAKDSNMACALQANGYKLTAPRLAVIAVLQAGEPHLTPGEVYERGKAVYPRLGLTTVYRTLDILAELGFLHRPHMGDNAASYSTCVSGHHGHIVCSRCDTVIELEECYLHGAVQALVDRTGFRIDSHFLEFIGLCPDCQ